MDGLGSILRRPRSHRRAALGIVVFSAGLLAGAGQSGGAPVEELRAAHARLSAWDLPGAIEILTQIQKAHPLDPNVRWLAAEVAFHRGRHAEALKAIEGLAVSGDAGDGATDLMRNAAEVTKDYVEDRSAGGHFVIRYPPGMNGVLAPLALEALERARDAVGRELGYLPPEQIAVEVMRGARDLAAMTGLTEAEIKATNTIAVCKFNRIMFITPAALAAGYPWLDTLNHEYAHYVTSRKTGDRVEVWLHETVSKMTETLWRGAAPALRPDHEGLIARALRDGALVTFAQMSPSMAKLPDENASALAFAEVFSAGLFVTEKAGAGALGRMLDAIAAGGGMGGGFQAVGFESMTAFETAWKGWLTSRFAGKAVVERQFYRAKFKEGRDGKAPSQEQAGDPAARNFLRLGDLLLARGHDAAAAEEFSKAAKAAGQPNPVVLNRLAFALLHAGRLDAAAAALAPVEERFPDYLSTHMNMGRIRLAQEKLDPAAASFQRAAAINPFDPEIWDSLARIHKAKGDRAAYNRDLENLKLVRE